MSKHALTVVVAVIIAVSLLLYMFSYTIRTSEVAVVLTFGKPTEQAPAPGYHLKWPWPIQEVRRFDNRLHASEGRFEETTTRDRHNVITSLFVGWKIADPLKFNENFGRAEDPVGTAWNSLHSIVRHRASATLGQHELRELVSLDKADYTAIEEKIAREASAEAQATYGMQVELVKVKRLELPESVMQKVHERMKAERNKEAQKIKSEGDQVAQVIRKNAESVRDEILQLARSEAEELRSQGDAAAAEFYGVFAKYPDLAIYLRKIRALREATKNKSTLIVDTTMPPFDLLIQGPPEVRALQGAKEKVAAAESK